MQWEIVFCYSSCGPRAKHLAISNSFGDYFCIENTFLWISLQLYANTTQTIYCWSSQKPVKSSRKLFIYHHQTICSWTRSTETIHVIRKKTTFQSSICKFLKCMDVIWDFSTIWNTYLQICSANTCFHLRLKVFSFKHNRPILLPITGFRNYYNPPPPSNMLPYLIKSFVSLMKSKELKEYVNQCVNHTSTSS